MNSERKHSSGLLFLLGMALLVLGLAFCALLGRGFLAAKGFDRWVETPALVLSSWVEELEQPGSDPSRYRLRIRYRYRVAGQEFISSRVREIETNTRVRSKVEALQAQYGVGDAVACFVDPQNPNSAILRRPTKAPGYTLWFPGLFAVGGAGMMWVAWGRRRKSGGAGGSGFDG